ncbi:MAG: quinolinate synthase NadA [Candidatus Altiarchaeota archaeon]|nr:quinolinate synthase NadA [Candidatus Altiarchaeota archaeon]
MELTDEILKLKAERNAVILAHNYQRPEVIDIADYVGDSLGLSRQASASKAKVIVFCGVDFMAETASIINPEKTVLLPAEWALCPMAMMLSLPELLNVQKEYPDAETVLYINTHADVKAHADCICTSANADKIVNSMKADTIIFGPDRNLAYYVRKRTKKKIVVVPERGLCPTHHMIQPDDVEKARRAHPQAELVVHPEVIPELQDIADHIASTEGMIMYCKSSPKNEFILGTESGIIHRMKKEMPEKKFYPASDMAVCNTMKMITLHHVRDSLRDMKHKVAVPKETADKARKTIERMLSVK